MRLFISTGEVSGDLQGSFLVHALQREAERRSVSLEIDAIGGPRMKAAGAELIADTAPIGAIGLFEALPLLLPTLKVQKRVDKFLRKKPPDAVVLIDYMEEEYDRECREKDVAPCTMKKYGDPPCGECDCCKEFESR